MGDGAVVTPEDSVVRAPEDGEVCFVFETKHAIGFLTDSGVSLLIHMGIDTVALNGEGFEVFVGKRTEGKEGQSHSQLESGLSQRKCSITRFTSPLYRIGRQPEGSPLKRRTNQSWRGIICN